MLFYFFSKKMHFLSKIYLYIKIFLYLCIVIIKQTDMETKIYKSNFNDNVYELRQICKRVFKLYIKHPNLYGFELIECFVSVKQAENYMKAKAII